MRLTARAERRREPPEGKTRDRRAGRGRTSAELVLDGIFRPGNWAARLARAMGLQGAGGVRLRTYLVPVKRYRHERVTAATGHGNGSTTQRGSGLQAAHGQHGSRGGPAPPLRIAFASDFHAGPTTDDTLLQDACDRLAEARADILLLGGDFVSVRGSYIRRLAPMLAKIDAPLGKFAVFGNHDLRADRGALSDALADAGVSVLTNRSVRLGPPHDDVSICGIDDPIFGTPDVQSLDADAGVRIVLMHAPDGLLHLGDRDFDLALCGHTHGGQVIFPWGGVLVTPRGKLSRRYCSGLHRLGPDGDRALLVSRGIGCSTIPVRLFAHPEVHLLVVG